MKKNQNNLTLPMPKCKYGYTRDQVKEIIGETRWDAYCNFATGQTCTLCPEHGVATYTCDIEQFLAGLPPLD